VVSGFSGAAPAAPAPNPVDKTLIDLAAPSLRAIDVGAMGPPQAQVVPAPKPLTITAGQIGQVFAVALDDAMPPNIYAAATSAYGLPIVVPDADGDGLPDRARRGAPNATFMAGLFGPANAGGGPGTIWRIDGRTGAVAVFANVMLDGAPNSGPALGGLAFDPASRLLFVADRDTGTIHGFSLDGQERTRFDHGAQGLPAIGLPPIAFDAGKRLNVQAPEFDSGDPATWSYAPASRRVFGLAVHRGRLYYAVAAGMRIWSVSLLPDGAFGPDARVEFAVPQGAQPGTEISKIIFDDAGDMIVAERGAPSGAYDFGALTAQDTGRVIRLRRVPPGAPPSPFPWQPVGDYAIGFTPNHQNGDGGVAIGYGYDPLGFVSPLACGGTLWTTGSQLRMTPEQNVAQRLAAGGPLPIDGLQGNAVSLMRPQNTPPFAAFFVDFDDRMEQPGTPGHMGDVVVWRICPSSMPVFAQYYPQLIELMFEDVCPAGTVRSRLQCMPSPCRPGEIYRGGKCEDPKRKKEPRKPDLAIVKTGQCAPHAPCFFKIVVTNTGDAAYTGPIGMGDIFSPGNITNISAPGWTCVPAPLPGNIAGQLPAGTDSWVCLDQNATLQPGQSVEFTVGGISPPTGKWKNCAIVIGDPAKETNWSNNKSCIEGGEDPNKDKPKEPNLEIVKQPGVCVRWNDAYRCKFDIKITNTGSADHVGEIVFTETFSPGTYRGHEISQGAGVRVCMITSPLAQPCLGPSNSAPLPPGQSVTIVVEVEFPAGTKYRNCVSIGSSPPASIGIPGALPGGPPNGFPGSSGNRIGGKLSCVDGDTPDDKPACPAGTIPTLRGGCCTPESIAAGTCGQTTIGCPAGTVSLPGGGCCPAGQVRRDGTCTPPTTTCIPGTPGCPPVTACPFPMFLVGTTCCTREAFASGKCGTTVGCIPGTPGCGPATLCPGGGRPVRGICPGGTTTCKPGQFRGDDGQCHERPTTRCRDGFRWDGQRCVGAGDEKPKSCAKGTHWDGRSCVKDRPPSKPQCGAGLRWDGRSCVKPPQKPKPAPGVKPKPGTKPVAPPRTLKPLPVRQIPTAPRRSAR
jgi:hypothetical protein